MFDRLVTPGLVSLAAGSLWLLALTAATTAQADQRSGKAVRELAAEVGPKGWIVYSARTQSGDWDLFLMRPDGSRRRNITNTRTANEAAVM